MNDPYGLIASGLPPDMAAEAMALQRRQQIAQAMMQQGMAPIDIPHNKGRFETAASPLSAVAKVVQAYLGNKMQMGADKEYAGLASKIAGAKADAMSGYERARDGSPAAEVPQIAPMDDEGNAMPAAIKPAQPGSPRAAIVQALANPLLAGNPMIAADLKKIEPNWAVHKSFDEKGREVQKLVNLNDPSQTREFGGAKAPELKPVTTVGADGRPVTRFVNPQESTGIDFPEAVKKEFKDTGKQLVPVDPYTQQQPIAKTTTPGEDQSRTTSLQVHGLGPDGLPTGDIKEVAKAIAEGRMPPLTGFAASSPRGQMILSEVSKINPTYDVKDYHAADQAVKAFASGKQGNSVRSFNVALSHLETLGGLADALQNGDTQLVNKLGNAVATQTGKEAPVKFDAAKKIVADEIVKAIVGSGGGVHDREEAARVISAANSPAQLKGVIATYTELMRGQLGGLRQQYEQSTGRKDFDKFLSEHGNAAAHAPAGGQSSVMDEADRILKGG